MFKRFFSWLFSSGQTAAQPEPSVQDERSSSFFSTDVDIPEGWTTNEERLQHAIAKAIALPVGQRVLPSGVGLDGDVTWAQDSAAMTGVKAQMLQGQAGVPDAQAFWFIGQGFIGYQLCALIAQNWLVQRACSMPARDAVRKGYQFKVSDGSTVSDEVMKAIDEGNKRYRLNHNLVQLVTMGRVFGIRVVMFKIQSDDPDFYVKPFNPDSIKPGSYRGISQIDPYWIVPELTTAAAFDPSSIDFYEPTYWIVNDKRVHKSHLVIMRGPEVADILKPAYLYGGLSVPQQIAERVYAAERTANEAPMLAMSKRSTVLYTDAAKAVANQGSFIDKLRVWANYRDNWGVKVADKNADKIEQLDTSLSDLDAVIMTNYQLVASIAEVPATKLLGTQPKGFNSTGDYETDSYHEMLESVQTVDMTPLIDRHMVCMIRSEIAPLKNDGQLFKVEVVWNPLSTLNATEQAAKNKTDAETDAILKGAGAITSDEIRERISNDEHSGYRGLPVLADQDPGLTDGDPQDPDAQA